MRRTISLLGLVSLLPLVLNVANAQELDAARRAKIIDGASSALTANYVFPDVAKEMAAAVHARQQQGDYDGVTDGAVFATKLTEDLLSVGHDKHIKVIYVPQRQPNEPEPTAAQQQKQLDSVNCGFRKVELLEGNIGYLKFDFFASPRFCKNTASAAMGFLGNADALIVDLRGNGGGDPEMIAFLTSYLFAKPTHLNDLWWRKGNKTQQFWTSAKVPGKLLADKPVYVLTSPDTFSGAEEFSNNLKVLKRATIIGETTGGGANPGDGRWIDEHFGIFVPEGRAINPYTHSNWEGVGVEPDVAVAAADALATAQELAAKKPPAR